MAPHGVTCPGVCLCSYPIVQRFESRCAVRVRRSIRPVTVGMQERPLPGYNHAGRLAHRAAPQLKKVTMESLHAKNVIIGAGAMGSSAAYHLARRGEPVVLIEQFGLGHDRGSSHGAARITRHSYADPAYARLMPAAFRAWKDFEADAGETVYLRTGGVSFSPQGVDYAERVAANLRELEIPHWRSSGRAWNAQLGAYSLPADYDVVFEPDAGMLSAARALALFVELARHHGGQQTQVLDHTPVQRIDLDGDSPVVLTDKLRIHAERLIVSAGAWVKQLLPELAVEFERDAPAGPVCRARKRRAIRGRPLPGLHLQGSRRPRRLLWNAEVSRIGRQGGAARRPCGQSRRC